MNEFLNEEMQVIVEQAKNLTDSQADELVNMYNARSDWELRACLMARDAAENESCPCYWDEDYDYIKEKAKEILSDRYTTVITAAEKSVWSEEAGIVLKSLCDALLAAYCKGDRGIKPNVYFTLMHPWKTVFGGSHE